LPVREEMNGKAMVSILASFCSEKFSSGKGSD
jgi:hypothetical protein